MTWYYNQKWNVTSTLFSKKPCFQSIPSQRIPLKEVCCLCRIFGSGFSTICRVLKSLVYHFTKPSSSRRRSGESPQTIIWRILPATKVIILFIYMVSQDTTPSKIASLFPELEDHMVFYIDSPTGLLSLALSSKKFRDIIITRPAVG